MASTVGGVNLKLGLKVGSFMRNMRLATKEMSFGVRNAGRLQEKVQKVGVTFGTMARGAHVATAALQAIGMAIVAATAALAAFAVASSRTFAEFEHEMARAISVTNGGVDRQASMYKKASDMAKKYGVQHKDVAKAMAFVGMAGNDVNEVLTMTDDIMAMATIGQMDYAAAGDIMTNIMTGFGLEAGEVTKTLNTLVGTMTNSNTNLRMLGDGMKYVSMYARELKLSLTQTSAALGFLADAGIQGEMGGTALRNVLSNFQQANKSKRKILVTAGMDIYDAKGNLKKDLAGILEDIERTQISGIDLGYVLGKRGMQGLLPLLGAGSKALRDYTEYLENYTDAHKLADQMLQSFTSKLNIFKATIADILMGPGLLFKNLFVEIGKSFGLAGDEVNQLKYDLIIFTADAVEGFLGFVLAITDVIAVFEIFGKTVWAIMKFVGRIISIPVTMFIGLWTAAAQGVVGIFKGMMKEIADWIVRNTPVAAMKAQGLDKLVSGIYGGVEVLEDFQKGLDSTGAAAVKFAASSMHALKNEKFDNSASKGVEKYRGSIEYLRDSMQRLKKDTLEAVKAADEFKDVKPPFTKKKVWDGEQPSIYLKDKAKSIAEELKAEKENFKELGDILEWSWKNAYDDIEAVMDLEEALAKMKKENLDIELARQKEIAEIRLRSIKQMLNGIDSSGFDASAVGDEVQRKNFDLAYQYMSMEEKRVALAERHNAQLERQLEAMKALTDVGRDMGNSVIDYNKAMADAKGPADEAIARGQLALDVVGAMGQTAMQAAKMFGASRRQMAIAQFALNSVLLIGAILTPGMQAAAIKAGTLMAGSLATMLISGNAKSTFSAPTGTEGSSRAEAEKARTQEAIEAALKAAGLWQNEARSQVYNYYGGDPLEYRNRDRDAARTQYMGRGSRRGGF